MLELADCTNTLLEFINTKEAKRDDIAEFYAMAICSSEDTDWKAVNRAIIDRWSLSALDYIKKRAWKMINTKRETPND